MLLDYETEFCVASVILLMFPVELTELAENSLTLITMADSVECTFVLSACSWVTDLRPRSCR